MAFKPTEEQEIAVEMFLSQRDTVVEAGAGTGKTSTLKLMAEAAPHLRGQYTAFNKAIVVDSKDKFPSSVKCNTAHSLAWWGIGKNYAERLNSSGRIKSHEIARRLHIEDIDIVVAEQARKIPGPFMAGHIMQAVTNFCQSADLEPTVRHFSYIPGIDEHSEDGKRGYTNNNIVQGYMLDYLVKAWQDLSLFDGQGGQLPFKHEHYLKAWQLSGPVIDADYVLFDEAQDASPVMLDIVLQQKRSQKIFVGDSCQPPDTLVSMVNGERKLIGDIEIGDRVVSYTKGRIISEKFGSVVLGKTIRNYNGELVNVVAGNKSSSYTLDHICMAKIGDAFDNKHLLYLMRQGEEWRVGVTKARHGTGPGRSTGIMGRLREEGGDAIWVLCVFDSRKEAEVAEEIVSLTWRIPQIRFNVKEFWADWNTALSDPSGCAKYFGRDLRYPFVGQERRYMLGDRFTEIRACNLISGMLMMHQNKTMHHIATNRTMYNGPVVSLAVSGPETYIGDGIVTHNCQQIYEWTGAVNALQNTGIKNKVFLSQSFRFGPAIADMANKVLTVLGAELRLRGLESIDSRLDYVDRPDCYLTRTNAAAVRRLLIELGQGQRPHLMGGGKDVMSFAEGAQKLKMGISSEHPDLACFASWAEVQEYVNHDPQGDELRLLVKLVDDFGPFEIIQAIRGMSSEDRASIIISTAHKAKGREWHSVELGDDFPTPKEGEGMPGNEELRLLYVAITRASHVLDISKCKLAQVINYEITASDETDETDEMSDETGFVDDPITIISKSERDYDPGTMVFQQMMFKL